MEFDLRFLNNVIQIDSKRDDDYERGAAKLTLAQEDVILNQELLVEANILFAQATQKNPRDFRPYFGLANIFYLMRDHYQAGFYLQQAQKLNVDLHDELQDIIVFLKESDQDNLNEDLAALTESLEQSESVDYDEFYEQTRDLLIKLTEQWTHRSQGFIASHDEGIVSQLFELKSIFEETLEHLEKQILFIDEEIDIDELEMALRPLQKLYNQCEEVYQISLIFKLLSQDIRQLNIQILHTIKQISDCYYQAEQLLTIEEVLESYLDQCDLISDELDTIAEQDVNIEVLELQFQQMAKHLALLQNQIDEIG